MLQNTEAAQNQLKTVLGILNNILATKTFLVGERVTLGDITCVCNLLLLYKQVCDSDGGHLQSTCIFVCLTV